MRLRTLGLSLLICLTAITFTACDEEAEKERAQDPQRGAPIAMINGFQDNIEHPLPDGIKGADWMSGLSDNTKVCNLSIPGTHDSMTGMGFYKQVADYIFNITSISQLASMKEQLNSGIRFFDIRSVVTVDTLTKEKELFCAHGISEIGVTLDSLFNDMIIPFLAEHPSEFIIVKLQHDNGVEDQGPWFALMEDFFEERVSSDIFYHWNSNMMPTVGDVRGKIVLMCRNDYKITNMNAVYVSWPDESADLLEDDYADEHGIPQIGYIDYEAEKENCFISLDPRNFRTILRANRELKKDPDNQYWKDAKDNAMTESSNIYVQDYYKSDKPERMATKIEAVKHMLTEANNTTDRWIINHCSAYTSVSPKGYCENAEKANVAAIGHILANPKKHCGIVVVDFAGFDHVSCVINGGTPFTSDWLIDMKPMSQSLTNLVIMSNF